MGRLKGLALAFAARFRAAVPVLLDVAGLGFMTYGVYLIETKNPGYWAILAGIGLVLAGLRAES